MRNAGQRGALLNPPIRACAPPLLSHLLISFPPGRGSGRARGAVWRVCASDCCQGPWACIINNEGALKKKVLRASQMRVCGLPVLSAASLSETERGAGGADTADPSSTATAAEPMRVGSAASAAGAPAQTTPSDCKLGANLSGNALGEDVNEETTRGLQLDPATTARTANAGPALPRGADISVLRHIDANNSAFNMLN